MVSQRNFIKNCGTQEFLTFEFLQHRRCSVLVFFILDFETPVSFRMAETTLNWFCCSSLEEICVLAAQNNPKLGLLLQLEEACVLAARNNPKLGLLLQFRGGMCSGSPKQP